jgi:hypothetical protein
MLLGFKRQFAPFVEEGSKTHTVRAIRKVRPRVGETCYCYVDIRQKTMRLLGRWPCVLVDDIRIVGGYGGIAQISIAGVDLSADEMRAFAWRDGFRQTDDPLARMSEFWQKTHGLAPGDVFSGNVIHWRPVAVCSNVATAERDETK